MMFPIDKIEWPRRKDDGVEENLGVARIDGLGENFFVSGKNHINRKHSLRGILNSSGDKNGNNIIILFQLLEFKPIIAR